MGFEENIMEAIDEEFGQEEVYMWSTYMLPNGHFLNPENSEDLDQDNLDYEHSDYDDWIGQTFGLKGHHFLDDFCIKMNVTYPYLYLPKNRITPAQVMAIKKVIDHSGEFTTDREGLFSWSQDPKIYNMEQPILFLTDKDHIVFDLTIHSDSDIIKSISRVYSLGKFLSESKRKNNESK